MALAAPKPCRYPGCGVLVPDGMCERHRSAVRSQVDERRSRQSGRRLYNARWAKASKQFLAEHPICECSECTRAGRVLPSQVTDHRTPHRGDVTLFWAKWNWQAMNKHCHDRKTAREDGGFGNAARSLAPGGG